MRRVCAGSATFGPHKVRFTRWVSIESRVGCSARSRLLVERGLGGRTGNSSCPTASPAPVAPHVRADPLSSLHDSQGVVEQFSREVVPPVVIQQVVEDVDLGGDLVESRSHFRCDDPRDQEVLAVDWGLGKALL